MKRATAYLRDGKIFLNTDSKTKAGFWILMEPIIMIEDISNHALISTSINKVLLNSVDGVPTPERTLNLVEQLLQVANVKSFNTFAKKASCVSIVKENNVIKFIPTENGGSKEGYKSLEDQEIVMTNINNEEDLSKTLLKGFELCK